MLIDQNTHIGKVAILPRWIYRFNKIPIKIPDGFLAEIYMVTLKFILKRKGSKIIKMILEKNKVEDSKLIPKLTTNLQ